MSFESRHRSSFLAFLALAPSRSLWLKAAFLALAPSRSLWLRAVSLALAHPRSPVAESGAAGCTRKIGKDDLRFWIIRYRSIQGPRLKPAAP